MQVVLVLTYSYDSGSTLGVYSSQALADTQIRRWVTLENAIYAQMNSEDKPDKILFPFRYYDEDRAADVLTFDRGGQGITSVVMDTDVPVALTVPPWLKDVPASATP